MTFGVPPVKWIVGRVTLGNKTNSKRAQSFQSHNHLRKEWRILVLLIFSGYFSAVLEVWTIYLFI